jgi:hypothetical protein
VLPLDLHVLGLPLAFILSQDQTLHCKLTKIIDEMLSCMLALPQTIKELICFHNLIKIISDPEKECKGKNFFNTPNNFFKNIFRLFIERPVCVSKAGRKDMLTIF